MLKSTGISAYLKWIQTFWQRMWLLLVKAKKIHPKDSTRLPSNIDSQPNVVNQSNEPASLKQNRKKSDAQKALNLDIVRLLFANV